MTQSQKIIDYLNANPEYLTGHYAKTAKKFNTTYESIRHHARKIRNKTTIAPADLEQNVVTPEGYTGKLKSGKMWQVYDGSWRESLQFDIDRIKEFNEFKDSFISGLENLHKISSNTKVKKDGDVAIEIALPDMHFGKGDVDDTVSNYLTIVDLIIKRTKGFNIVSGYALINDTWFCHSWGYNKYKKCIFETTSNKYIKYVLLNLDISCLQ